MCWWSKPTHLGVVYARSARSAPSTPWAAGQLESRPHTGPLQRSGSRPKRGHGGAMVGLKSTKKNYVTRCYTKITSMCCCCFNVLFFLQMLSPRFTTLLCIAINPGSVNNKSTTMQGTVTAPLATGTLTYSYYLHEPPTLLDQCSRLHWGFNQSLFINRYSRLPHYLSTNHLSYWGFNQSLFMITIYQPLGSQSAHWPHILRTSRRSKWLLRPREVPPSCSDLSNTTWMVPIFLA